MTPKVLVSRCLLGHRVRYDGGASGPYAQLAQWQAEGRVIALCPEVAGGLPTPRAAAEIPGGQGVEVLAGKAAVITTEGEDVTEAFVSLGKSGSGCYLKSFLRQNTQCFGRFFQLQLTEYLYSGTGQQGRSYALPLDFYPTKAAVIG